MCQYITLTLSKEVNLRELKPLFEQFGMNQLLIQNPYVQKQLQAGDYYLNTTSHMCDCDSVIASNQKYQTKQKSYAREITRMKKKGWSETKIQRWMKQKENSTNTKKMKQDHERWHNFLHALLSTHQVIKVGLLVHWYQDSFYTEAIEIKDKKTIRVHDMKEETLINMEYDILYEFN